MRAIRFNKFIEEEDRVDWLVEGLLPNVGWTLFVGAKGIGKSTFALQLCRALSQNIVFLNMATTYANCLYIQADSVTVEWREMVRRIAPESHAFTCIDVEDKCLSNPKYVDNIVFIIETIKPDFIVFDSLYNLTNESINTEGVLRPINIMKQVCNKKPFLLIHHPPNEQERAAGHHSLPANCSNEWFLTKNRLVIKKGRLVNTKRIDLGRDENGLWVTKEALEYHHPMVNQPI